MRSHLWKTDTIHILRSNVKERERGILSQDEENLVRTFQNHNVERKLRLEAGVHSYEMGHRNMNWVSKKFCKLFQIPYFSFNTVSA